MFGLEPILMNLLMYVGGPALILFLAYLYGRNQSSKDNALKAFHKREEQAKQAFEAERKVIQLEAKRNEAVEKVRAARDVSGLVRMWREGSWGSSPGKPSDKKTD